MPSVFVHVVTFDSGAAVLRCIESIISSEGFSLWEDLFILVTDNASTDGSFEQIEEKFQGQIRIQKNERNLGFSAAHNAGIALALSRHMDFIFVLNPDVVLEKDCLRHLVSALGNDLAAGCACPKLYRADEALAPVEPREFDSTGMYITPSIRHFDRGSGILDARQFDRDEYVFGASGAAVLLRSDFVKDVCLRRGREMEVFDENFFAYREDADLAWRAQWLGWKTRYVAQAIAYHRRKVLPENRRELPAALNRYSVRNRFLLQWNNVSGIANLHCLASMWIRNFVVIAGVLFREWDSLPGIFDAFSLQGACRSTRRGIAARSRANEVAMSRWFRSTPYIEPVLQQKIGNIAESRQVILLWGIDHGPHSLDWKSLLERLTPIFESRARVVALLSSAELCPDDARLESIVVESHLSPGVVANHVISQLGGSGVVAIFRLGIVPSERACAAAMRSVLEYDNLVAVSIVTEESIHSERTSMPSSFSDRILQPPKITPRITGSDLVLETGIDLEPQAVVLHVRKLRELEGFATEFETFTATLSDFSQRVVSRGMCIATIVDSPPQSSLSSTAPQASEEMSWEDALLLLRRRSSFVGYALRCLLIGSSLLCCNCLTLLGLKSTDGQLRKPSFQEFLRRAFAQQTKPVCEAQLTSFSGTVVLRE